MKRALLIVLFVFVAPNLTMAATTFATTQECMSTLDKVGDAVKSKKIDLKTEGGKAIKVKAAGMAMLCIKGDFTGAARQYEELQKIIAAN